MERVLEYQRAKQAFERAQISYDPGSLATEQVLYEAAKAFARVDYPSPEAAARALARIHKRRWRREPTDSESLTAYLTYLGQYGHRRILKDRAAGARACERVASILARLAPTPASVFQVMLMGDLCRTAATQYLIVEQPTKAIPPSQLALRYARSFVLWDRKREHAVVVPLGLASKVAFANREYSKVVEYQKEVLGITIGWSKSALGEKQFTNARVYSPRDQLAMMLEAQSRFGSFTDMSASDRESVMAFVHHIPSGRGLGEDYRLLGQAHAGAGDTAEALDAFDLAMKALTAELASASNRLLALDVALEAIELCARIGDRAEVIKRARDAVVQAAALKSHGVTVPQLPAFLARTGDRAKE